MPVALRVALRKATGTDVTKFRLIFAGKVLSMWDTLWDSGIHDHDSTINMHYRTLGGHGPKGYLLPPMSSQVQYDRGTAHDVGRAASCRQTWWVHGRAPRRDRV